MRQEGRCGVVLAGRPYHLDPEINHGIPELIASYGLDVLTEDNLPIDFTPERPLRERPVGIPLPPLHGGEFAGATVSS